MTQITSIKLGLIAICIAAVPLSLAQTPRTGTSGSNKTAATIGTAAGHSGLSGNFPSAVQTGTNFRSGASAGPNPNAGAHIGINAGAQTGISVSTGGITGAAAGGLGSSSGNSTGTTQIGTNARAGTNTTGTNAGAHAAAAIYDRIRPEVRHGQRGRTYERSAAFLLAELMQRFCKATINTCR
jgi:hypothetical protein